MTRHCIGNLRNYRSTISQVKEDNRNIRRYIRYSGARITGAILLTKDNDMLEDGLHLMSLLQILQKAQKSLVAGKVVSNIIVALQANTISNNEKETAKADRYKYSKA